MYKAPTRAVCYPHRVRQRFPATAPHLRAALMAIALGANAHAAPPSWLTVTTSAECTADVVDLATRVDRAVVGHRRAGASASLAIEPYARGFAARIVVDSAGERSDKVIQAPTCDEALDAAVLVLSLALGSDATSAPATTETARSPEVSPYTAPDTVSVPSPPEGVSVPPALEPPTPAAAPPDADRAVPARRRQATAVRVSATGGVDVGTLSRATAVANIGAAGRAGPIDLRAVLRYGLPNVEEDVTTAFRRWRREDFAAVELGACSASLESLGVALCASGELGALRRTRTTETVDGATTDSDAVTPRVAGVVTGVLSHRGGPVEPLVEVSAVGVAAGKEPNAPSYAVRVVAGASVPF